jgi:hypothetical protein
LNIISNTSTVNPSEFYFHFPRGKKVILSLLLTNFFNSDFIFFMHRVSIYA